jgi:C-terminal processing protease CtpA/Prc
MKYTIRFLLLLMALAFHVDQLGAQSVVLVQDVHVNEKVGKSDPKLNRQRGMNMLKGVKEALEEHYYDKNYRGIDINAKFKEAGEKIKTMETNAQIFRVIAGLLLDFNDSHTRFYPPGRSYRVEYGFSMQMVGDRCLVVNVKKGSDAEKKGIRIGDQVLKIGQYDVTRDSLWVLNYYLYELEPMPVVPVTIASPEGGKAIAVQASFKSPDDRRKESEKARKEKRENPYRCHKLSSDVTR